jgi:tetratricopeptide (TPR) repeat protein
MAEVYKTIYHDKHYVISIALSNIAGVLQERKQYAQAEALFREAVQRYDSTLAPDHQLVGIARVRLGRVLRLEGRFADAEKESRAGLAILLKQSSPAPNWVKWAQGDLAANYDSLGRAADAAKVRADSVAMENKAP